MSKYLILLTMVVVGCGGSAGENPGGSGGDNGTGGSDGVSCVSDTGCPDGTFCLNNFCTFACEDDLDCAEGQICTSRGRCSFDFGSGGAGGEGGTGGSNVCQDVSVTPNRVVPNIHLIVDRSGSMGWDFSGDQDASFADSRYKAVIDTLVGDAGVLPEMEGLANFDLTLYWKDGQRRENRLDDMQMCEQVDTATGSDIAQVLNDNRPGGYTPTAEAIWNVLEGSPAISDPLSPTIFLLATDGQPNGCDQDEEPEDQANSIGAVTEAFDRGIETYVLGVSFEADHLLALAEAGGQEDYARANDASSLRASFEAIITENISCEVMLDESIVNAGDNCAGGTATLDGVEIECGEAWNISGPNTIQLSNGACEAFKTGQEFAAEFPCGSVVVQ